MLKLTRYLAALCLCILIHTGCDDRGFFDASVTFSGTVLDSITRLPIDSAGVCLFDTTNSPLSFSDSLGNFKLSPFGGIGEYDLYFLKEGYLTKKISVYMHENHLVDNILVEMVPVPEM